MWIGSSVHTIAKWLINSIVMTKSLPPYDVVLDRLNKNMIGDWEASQRGYYRGDPKNSPGLIEHYYQVPINGDTFDQALEDATRCVNNLYQSPYINNVLQNPNIRVLSAEKLEMISIKGEGIWVICDLVLQWHEKIYIVDWKTGKSSEDGKYDIQLATYVLYALNKGLCFKPEEIIVHLVNLNLPSVMKKEINQEIISTTENYIHESAEEMIALLRDVDMNIAEKEDFPFTDNQNQCRYCKFRKACGRQN